MKGEKRKGRREDAKKDKIKREYRMKKGKKRSDKG